MINDLYQKWDEMYELALKYYEKHGNLNIPVKFKTNNGYEYDKDGKFNLGEWLYYYKNFSKYDEDKMGKLLDIGLKIKDSYYTWEEMYGYAEIYFKFYNNLNVPKNFKTNNGYEFDENGNVNLGLWINTQRKNKKLSFNKMILLDYIGMIWKINENRILVFDLCEEYGINYKKNSVVLSLLAFNTFNVKIKFLIDQGISIFDKKGKLHEIFSMNDNDMKKEYGYNLKDLINKYNFSSKEHKKN